MRLDPEMFYWFTADNIFTMTSQPPAWCPKCVLAHHAAAPCLSDGQRQDAWTFPIFKANQWAYFLLPEDYDNFLRAMK